MKPTNRSRTDLVKILGLCIGSLVFGGALAFTGLPKDKMPAPTSTCTVNFEKWGFPGRICTGVLLARDKVLTTSTCIDNISRLLDAKVTCGSENPIVVSRIATDRTYVWKSTIDYLDKTDDANAASNMAVLTLERQSSAIPAKVELDISQFSMNECFVAGAGDANAGTRDGTLEATKINEYGPFGRSETTVVSELIFEPSDIGAPMYCKNSMGKYVVRAIATGVNSYVTFYERLDANSAFIGPIVNGNSGESVAVSQGEWNEGKLLSHQSDSSGDTGPGWPLALFFVALLVISIIILYRNAASIKRPVRVLYAIVAPIIFVVCMLYNIMLLAKLMPLIFGAAADSPGLGFLTATPLAVVGVRLWYLALRRVARADSTDQLVTLNKDNPPGPDLTPDRPSPEPRGPPSIALGILMLVIVGPIVVSIAIAIIFGSITSPGSLLLAAGVIVVGTAVIAHFFFGHRATWILPVLVILMGIMGVTAGIYGRELVMFLFGAMLIVVGVAWKVPTNATHPMARRIVDIRTALLSSTNDLKK